MSLVLHCCTQKVIAMMIPDVSFVVSCFLRSLIRTDIITCVMV